MSYKTVFQRREIKYLLSSTQLAALREAIDGRMQPDEWGASTITNIYFDTDSSYLARRSLEKPLYKEKLRLRSYGPCRPESTVFLEIKKKYKNVVYKRRISLPEWEVMAFFAEGRPLPDSQIARELGYFCEFYGPLRPAMVISYDREPLICREEPDFRLTFDRNLLYRVNRLSLCAPRGGHPLLGAGLTLMECKAGGGMPLFMTRALAAVRAFPTSLSKYGRAFELTELAQKGARSA